MASSSALFLVVLIHQCVKVNLIALGEHSKSDVGDKYFASDGVICVAISL